MSLALIDRANRAMNTITPENFDFSKYLNREEKARVISAESLAEEGRRRILLPADHEAGLTLPFEKTAGKVLIKKGKLVEWAGWSRHGKTAMCKQVMVHAMQSGEKVCIASMEEEAPEVWGDMAKLACAAENPSPRSLDLWDLFSKSNLWFYDQQGRVKAAQMKAVIYYAATELGVTQFVVDSLMMMAIAKDDYAAQIDFVADLKTIAGETGCTIHLVLHMRKRDGKGGEDSPGSLHDVAGGQELGAIADYNFIVWRDIRRANADGFPAVLRVEKQRGRIDLLGDYGFNFDRGCRQFFETNPTRYCAEKVDF